MEIDINDVHTICRQHQIKIKSLTSVGGSFGKQLFFINQELLLRLSEGSMAREQEKFRRLTLYQIEHEIQQIIWQAGEAESWRVPRLVGWMDGDGDDLFRQIR